VLIIFYQSYREWIYDKIVIIKLFTHHVWKFACVTSPAVSEIYSGLCISRATRVIIDLRQRRRRCWSCCERYPRSRVLAADGDARCQRFLAGNYATGSGCSGTWDCLKSRGTSRSRSSGILLVSTRVTEILDPPYRVVREIQGVELCQIVEILDLANEVVV